VDTDIDIDSSPYDNAENIQRSVTLRTLTLGLIGTRRRLSVAVRRHSVLIRPIPNFWSVGFVAPRLERQQRGLADLADGSEKFTTPCVAACACLRRREPWPLRRTLRELRVK